MGAGGAAQPDPAVVACCQHTGLQLQCPALAAAVRLAAQLDTDHPTQLVSATYCAPYHHPGKKGDKDDYKASDDEPSSESESDFEAEESGGCAPALWPQSAMAVRPQLSSALQLAQLVCCISLAANCALHLLVDCFSRPALF